jgi:hypothetical protein
MKKKYCPNCGKEVPNNFVLYIKDEDGTCRHITDLTEEGLVAY